MDKPVKRTRRTSNKVARGTVKSTSGATSRREELALLADDFDNVSFLNEDRPLVYVPTVLPSYNRAIRLGGHPAGCITLFHGPWAGGKTTLVVALLRSFQEAGHLGIFVDAERTADKKWFMELGASPDTLMHRPESYEETIKTVFGQIERFHKGKKDGKIDPERLLFIAVDSINKLTPESELESISEMGKKGRQFPLRALMNSAFMDRLTPVVGRGDVAFVILAQERVLLDAKPFGPQYKVKGGQAILFDSTVVVRVSHGAVVREEGVEVGKAHRFRIEKNKVGLSREEGTFYTSNGQGTVPTGFDFVREITEEALLQDVIKSKGSIYYHPEYCPEKGAKGKAGLRAYLTETAPGKTEPRWKDLAKELRKTS